MLMMGISQPHWLGHPNAYLHHKIIFSLQQAATSHVTIYHHFLLHISAEPAWLHFSDNFVGIGHLLLDFL